MSAYHEAKSLFSANEENVENGADREGGIAQARDSSTSKFRAMQEVAGLSNLPQLNAENRNLLARVSARIDREIEAAAVPVLEAQINEGQAAPSSDAQYDVYAYQPVKAARG